VFQGSRWLDIAVRPGASTGAYTAIGRQPVTPSPTSIRSTEAATAPWSGLQGVPSGFADGVDNDVLGGLGCAVDGVPRRNATSWACSTALTGLAVGSGLQTSGGTFPT